MTYNNSAPVTICALDASTSPPIMLDLLKKAFPEQMAAGWEARLKQIVPSYGRKLNDSPALTNEIRTMTGQALKLPYLEVPVAAQTPVTVEVPTLSSPAVPANTRNANAEMQAL